MISKEASRQLFLPGQTTDGHYQIEVSCVSCHTKEFTAPEDFQAACVKCHGPELDESQDSHPESKFTDPRNADRVAQLDARSCVTCHSEHQPERTGTMGLSLPGDYCHRCHQDIAEERPSHVGLPFDSCASVGCHNFHDNRAIYEDYLVKRAGEPTVLALAVRPTKSSADCPSERRAQRNEPGAVAECAQCHKAEAEAWWASRHGMRLSLELPAMTPGDARLPMKTASESQQLGCGSCHGGDPNAPQPQAERSVRWVEIEACLGCHDDQHSRVYKQSRHFELFELEQSKRVAVGSGATCATCHLPRVKDEDGNLRVDHNQNHNLRPVEKQVRTVCGNCHGLAFSLDALADPKLLANNFSGQPSVHVKSVDWALARN